MKFKDASLQMKYFAAMPVSSSTLKFFQLTAVRSRSPAFLLYFLVFDSKVQVWIKNPGPICGNFPEWKPTITDKTATTSL